MGKSRLPRHFRRLRMEAFFIVGRTIKRQMRRDTITFNSPAA